MKQRTLACLAGVALLAACSSDKGSGSATTAANGSGAGAGAGARARVKEPLAARRTWFSQPATGYSLKPTAAI